MRWYDWLVVVTVGAFLGGAYLAWLRPEAVLRLSQLGIDRAYHDTYYVVAQMRYVWASILAALVGAGLYGGLVRWLAPRLGMLGALTLAVFLGGLALGGGRFTMLETAGMPRRYVDYEEAFRVQQYLSDTSGGLALVSGGVFLGLSGLRLVHLARRG